MNHDSTAMLIESDTSVIEIAAIDHKMALVSKSTIRRTIDFDCGDVDLDYQSVVRRKTSALKSKSNFRN